MTSNDPKIETYAAQRKGTFLQLVAREVYREGVKQCDEPWHAQIGKHEQVSISYAEVGPKGFRNSSEIALEIEITNERSGANRKYAMFPQDGKLCIGVEEEPRADTKKPLFRSLIGAGEHLLAYYDLQKVSHALRNKDNSLLHSDTESLQILRTEDAAYGICTLIAADCKTVETVGHYNDNKGQSVLDVRYWKHMDFPNVAFTLHTPYGNQLYEIALDESGAVMEIHKSHANSKQGRSSWVEYPQLNPIQKLQTRLELNWALNAVRNAQFTVDAQRIDN